MHFKHIVLELILLCNIKQGNTELTDYFRSIGTYFGYGKPSEQSQSDEILDHIVPYEASASDEKFILEVAKLTDIVLSELDSCQHKVVLKLQTSCDKMNDEQLAKMAVMLLNCQSAVEGRKIYPCTDTMSIKDCTLTMDADTWNSYHLMSNRARAVCYSVRQQQFRGLTEHTVNRLMDAAKHQLFTLHKISKDQEHLHSMAENSLNIVAEGQKRIMNQQKDLEMAQFHSQLSIEDNIKRLLEEKRIIAETHSQLRQMTQSVQGKLDEATKQLQSQSKESLLHHQEILDDLTAIQNKAHIIFQRIEDSSKLLLEQSEIAHKQYQNTLAQLAEVNATVHSLVTLVTGTSKAFEEKLSWLSTALGGTDLVIERLYAILWHSAFLLVAMIASAFLGARLITRLIVASVPPLNLVLTLQKSFFALEPVELITAVVGMILVQVVTYSLMAFWQSDFTQKSIPWIREKLTPNKTKVSLSMNGFHSSQSNRHTYNHNISSSYLNCDDEANDGNDSFKTSTADSLSAAKNLLSRSRSKSPFVLNGAVRQSCCAKTRMGTPCKLTTLPGRDFCYRHQSGDSIYVS